MISRLPCLAHELSDDDSQVHAVVRLPHGDAPHAVGVLVLLGRLLPGIGAQAHRRRRCSGTGR